MPRPSRLVVSCFILAFCSLNYEFLLAQMMAILGGHTVLFYCLTIGIYIFALGMGSIIGVEGLPEDRVQRRLYTVELLLCALGGGAPVWMIGIGAGLEALNNHMPPPIYVSLLPHAALVIAIGILSGMEMPLLLRLAEIRGMKNLVTRLMAVDYFASFFGAISFPLFFFPTLGIVRAASMLAMFNLMAIALVVPLPTREWRFYVTASTLVLTLAMYVGSTSLGSWLSGML